MPSPKHPCWDQTPDNCSSSESNTDPNRVESQYTNSCSTDSIMSTDEEIKTNPGCQDNSTPEDPLTSSFSWGATSLSDIDLYSIESRSTTKSKSTETETAASTSFSEQRLDCPYHQCGLHLSGGHVLGLEGISDCTCSEYGSNDIVDTELEHLLYSTGVDPRNYVLSSGRWSVNQDVQGRQGGEKLTIDKEFEQYFSMLML